MARFLVVASARGYFAGKLQMPGDRFEADDKSFSENWMERVGGAASAAPSNAPTAPIAPAAPVTDTAPVVPVVVVEAVAPAGPVHIPADWRTIHWKQRVALAKAISGLDEVTPDLALTIIGAEADNRDALARLGKTPDQAPAPAPAADLSDAALVAEAEAIAAAAEAADTGAAEPTDEDDI